MTLLVASVVLALFLSFVCSISEAALLSVSHVEAQKLGDGRAGALLKRFKKEIDQPIAALVVLNTAADTIGASVAGASVVDMFGSDALVVFSLVFTVAVLVFGEIVPKTIGALQAGLVIRPAVYFVSFLMVVFWPLVVLTKSVTKMLRGGERPVTSLEEIRLLAELGKAEGALAERTAKMIEGASKLRDIAVYDVMVPRTAMVFLSGKKTLQENLELVRRSGFSRFPYSEVGEADKVQGVVLARDVLFHLLDRDSLDLEELAGPTLSALTRKTAFISENTKIEQLLREFQERRHHMAVVVDEYGGTEGIVTLEDVVEEVVGEIQDELDRADHFIIQRSDGSLVCRGRAETRKVFELIGLFDVDSESVSLGGFVAEKLGRVPVAGDRLRIGKFEFLVERASARRAERIVLRGADSEPPRGESDPPPSPSKRNAV